MRKWSGMITICQSKSSLQLFCYRHIVPALSRRHNKSFFAPSRKFFYQHHWWSASETCRWSTYLARSGDARIWHLQKMQQINLVFMSQVMSSGNSGTSLSFSVWKTKCECKLDSIWNKKGTLTGWKGTQTKSVHLVVCISMPLKTRAISSQYSLQFINFLMSIRKKW